MSAIEVDFALEAKCYGVNNPVGMREVSRLISASSIANSAAWTMNSSMLSLAA
jgi:hypothetical protein